MMGSVLAPMHEACMLTPPAPAASTASASQPCTEKSLHPCRFLHELGHASAVQCLRGCPHPGTNKLPEAQTLSKCLAGTSLQV